MRVIHRRLFCSVPLFPSIQPSLLQGLLEEATEHLVEMGEERMNKVVRIHDVRIALLNGHDTNVIQIIGKGCHQPKVTAQLYTDILYASSEVS